MTEGITTTNGPLNEKDRRKRRYKKNWKKLEKKQRKVLNEFLGTSSGPWP